MKNKGYAISEAVGCIAICSAATALRFVYGRLGPGALTILFGAVNESVWEHVKIFSAAYAGYALLQLLWIRTPFRQYVVSKCAGLYILMGGIIALQYGAAALLGRRAASAEFLGASAVVILVQLLSYRLTVGDFSLREYFAPAVFLLTLYYLMFFSFTIYPPRAELFRDPLTGGYGCPGMIPSGVFGNSVEK